MAAKLEEVRANLKAAEKRLADAERAQFEADAEVKRQDAPFEARKKALEQEMLGATVVARKAREDAWRRYRESQNEVEVLKRDEQRALGEFELEEARAKVRTLTLVNATMPGVKLWPTPMGTVIPVPAEYREPRKKASQYGPEPLKVVSDFTLESLYVDTSGGRGHSTPHNAAWAADGVDRGVVIGMRHALRPGYGVRECYAARALDRSYGRESHVNVGHRVDFLVLSVRGNEVRVIETAALEHLDISGHHDGVDKTERVIEALA